MAAAPGPENIVVTGRTRAEALQTAPVQVTVFNSKAITDDRIQDVSDFIALTPNVSVVEAQNAGTSFISIRGISQVRNGQSPVAIVVDGVQQTDPRQFTQDLFNTKEIEVLEGPQGALYGRNAVGGAIVINTKQPTADYHASIDTSGGNGGDARVNGDVSGPIIPDVLLFRASGLYHNFDGLLDNVYRDKEADFSRQYAGRGQLKAIVTDNLTLDASFGANETHAGALDYHYQPAKLVPGTCFLDAANPFGGPPANADFVDRTFCSNNTGYDNRDVQDASLRARYTLPFAVVSNALSAVRVTELFGGDGFPYTASHNVEGLDEGQTQYSRTSSWSDDLRITSNSDQRFRWMLGGYYLNERDFLSSATSIDEGLGVIPISKTPAYNNPINPTSTFYADADKSHQYSIFGDVSYDIVKRLTLEFGYRYDWSTLDQYAEPDGTGVLPPGCSRTARANCTVSKTFSKPQPKVTLNYKFNHNIDLFTDYGIGFRQGQFNQSGTPQAGGLPGVANLVSAETARTFEAGIKTQWLDDRLRLDATFFDTDDSNPFYFVFVGSVGAQILVNINRVRLWGGELVADYRPVDGLDLFATWGHTESSIKSYIYNPADVGNRAPYVPLNTITAGAQSHFPITEHLGGFARGDVEVHGRQYWDPENDTARTTFALVNAQLGVEDPKGRWTATAYVKNLGDRAYNAEYVSGGFAEPAEPRTYGVELRYFY